MRRRFHFKSVHNCSHRSLPQRRICFLPFTFIRNGFEDTYHKERQNFPSIRKQSKKGAQATTCFLSICFFFFVTDQTDYLSNIYMDVSFNNVYVPFPQRSIFIYLTIIPRLISQDFLSTAVDNTVIRVSFNKETKQKKGAQATTCFLRCIHHRHFKRKRLYRRMKSRGRALSKHENQTDVFHESHRIILQ